MISRRILLAFLLLLASAADAHAAPPPLTVYAAASLTDVLGEIGTAFTRSTGTPVKFSFAASSVLARQIEAGSQADVFVSADEDWMDYLAARSRLLAGSRVDVAANRLVLIAPADSNVHLRIAPGFALAPALGGGRLATGDPTTVPIGRYARTALEKLGVWRSVETRIAGAENVRAALTFVARGEAPLGIVYATDARSDPRVRVVDVFPADTHPPVIYPAAATTGAAPTATTFVTFLTSAEARAVFGKYGFLPAAVAPAPDAIATVASPCPALPWPLDREVALFGGPARTVVAGTRGADAPRIDTDTLYAVTLAPTGNLTFVHAPERDRGDGFGGIARFALPSDGRYRVTLSAAAWIDVVRAGALVRAERFVGKLPCPLLHKSVEYELTGGAPTYVQISGAAARDVRLAVTRVR